MNTVEESDSKWLPSVEGRRMAMTNQDFERACRVLIGQELDKVNSDSSLINVLCEAVRMAREYSDAMQEGRRQ